MADALIHRGPDDDGFVEHEGVGLANRRLSIVGLTDGHQPAANEDGSVVTVFNGELFDYPEVKHRARGQGHRFSTHCDTELLPHLWDEHQERMLEHLRGQFAFALHDASPSRRSRLGTVSASARCTGRGKRRVALNGCYSRPRSRRCSPPGW